MGVIATTNTQNYENIANGLRTAGDLSIYKSELAIDAEIFEDVSEAIQRKTGQVDPYDKTELADAIDALPPDIGIYISDTSDIPVYFGINNSGFYICTTEAERTPVALGRDGNAIYAESIEE